MERIAEPNPGRLGVRARMPVQQSLFQLSGQDGIVRLFGNDVSIQAGHDGSQELTPDNQSVTPIENAGRFGRLGAGHDDGRPSRPLVHCILRFYQLINNN